MKQILETQTELTSFIDKAIQIRRSLKSIREQKKNLADQEKQLKREFETEMENIETSRGEE